MYRRGQCLPLTCGGDSHTQIRAASFISRYAGLSSFTAQKIAESEAAVIRRVSACVRSTLDGFFRVGKEFF
jgi:hypothetical protein